MVDQASPARRDDYLCIYCGEPLAFGERGVEAWRVGDKFVCNEFCADGISPGSSNPKSRSGEDAHHLSKWIYPTD